MIDLSHEALMRNWSRLSNWLDEEAHASATYRRLAESALLRERGEEGLLFDPQLSIALEWHERERPTRAWAVRYHSNFEGALAFLETSVAGRHRELAAVEELQMRQRKWEQRTIWLMLATAGVTASAMIIWAWLSGTVRT